MQLPRADVPNPIAPQTWHFRQSIEYSLTNNYAVLDIASKRKEDFLFNMYRMAKNAIDKGSRDNWTIHPTRIAAFAKSSSGHARQLVALRRSVCMNQSSTIPPSATREDTCCRPINRISSPPRNSSTF
jgi:hypothetical protein